MLLQKEVKMAITRYREFAAFVSDGKARTFGELIMCGDRVWSYNTVIAEIDRNTRTINLLTTKFSRTTTRHQSAVSMSGNYLPNGWVINRVEQL